MSLIIVTLVAFAVSLIINRVVLPSISKMRFRKSKFSELTKISWLAFFGYIGRFTKVAAYVYTGIWLLLQLSNTLATVFKSNNDILSNIFHSLTGFNEWLVNLNEQKFFYVLVSLTIVFILLIVRNARRYTLSVYQKISNDFKNGNLNKIPPSEEMIELDKNIEAVQSDLNQVASIDPIMLSSEEQQKQVEAIEYLNTLISNSNILMNELDIRRRIIPTLENQTNQSKPNTWLEKVMIFFTSQGLVKTIYKTSKTLGTLGLALIMLSFLVATKNVVTDATVNVTRNISTLQLEYQQQQLDKEWEEALTQNQPIQGTLEEEIEWNAEEEEVLDKIARGYELAIARSLTRTYRIPSRVIAFRAKATTVKQAVIKNYATTIDGKIKPGFEVVEEGKYLNSSTIEQDFAKKYSKTYNKNINSKKPTTNYGKAFKKQLKEKIGNNKGLLEKIKTNSKDYIKSFSTSANSKDVLGIMLGEYTQEALKGTNIADGTTVQGKLFNETFGRASNKTVRAYINLQTSQFTNDLVHKEFGEAIKNIEQAKTPASKFMSLSTQNVNFPQLEQVTMDLSNHPPALKHNPLTEKQIMKSSDALRNMASNSGRNTGQFAEALSNFTHFFPGQVGMENSSPVNKFNGNYNTNRVNVSPTSSSGKIATNLPAGRARSFKTLKGFRRIGGVLIGQEPNNTTNTDADFRDITWVNRGNQIEIFLHRVDGKKLSVGVYDKDIVQQALAYNADGRPITVTMVTGKPMHFLKILLHPTLIDTDLGCKAIGLDRLVDKYASEDEKIDKALKGYKYQELLYKYVCLHIIGQNNYLSIDDLFTMLAEPISSIQTNYSEIYSILEEGDIFDQKLKSHIAGKSQLYNSQVIKLIQQALKNSEGDYEYFFDYIKENSSNIDATENELIKITTEQWSGVRESPYKVDKDLNFLKPSAKDNPNTFPLTFMRQIVYSPLEENDSPSSNEASWEFPNLKQEKVIENLVWEGIQSNPSDLLLLNKMKSFALLQRVFRVAMNGDLGLEFPIERLLELSELTRNDVPVVPTPTWNSSGMTYENYSLLLSLRGIPEEELNDYKTFWESQEIGTNKNLFPCN